MVSIVTVARKGMRREGRWCVETHRYLQGVGAPQTGVTQVGIAYSAPMPQSPDKLLHLGL